MFLDFLNNADNQAKHAPKFGGKKSARRPQVIVLIGDFEEKEIACFRQNLACHFGEESGIFRFSMFSPAEPDASFPKVEQPDASGLRTYEDYAKGMDAESFGHFADQLAAEVFNATQGMLFEEADSVMLSLLLKPDQSQSGCMEKLATMLKKSLAGYFGSTYLDLYLMLDEGAFTEQKLQKEAAIYRTMTAAEGLIRDNTARLCYVLSNVDSKGHFLVLEKSREEQYASIALLMALKNLTPDNADHNYADASFGAGVTNKAHVLGREAGALASAGHIRLQTDAAYNRLVSYRQVWEMLARDPDEADLKKLEKDLGMEEVQIRQHFQKEEHAAGTLTEGNFDAIVRNQGIQEASIYTMRNETAIQRIFGENLDLFERLNRPKGDADQKVNGWVDVLRKRVADQLDHVPCSSLACVFRRLEQTVERLIQDAKDHEQHARKALEEWKGKTVTGKKGSARHGASPLLELANAYLERKRKVAAMRRQKEMYEKLLEKIQAMGKVYLEFQKLARDNAEKIGDALEHRYATVIHQTGSLGKLQLTHADIYYAEETRGLVEQDEQSLYKKLCKELYQQMAEGRLDQKKIYEAFQKFFEKDIFSAPVFHCSFLEELEQRLMGYEEPGGVHITTPTDVSNFLLTTIDGAKRYLFRDAVFGGSQFYEEICLFLNNDALFLGKKKVHAIMAKLLADEKMRLFCDDTSDRLDVLFLAGNLRANSLQQWSGYEASYKKWSERIEDDRALSNG